MAIPLDMTCPLCLNLFVEPHVVCANAHNLCGDCAMDLLEHGDVKCPECRGTMDIERNRLACSAVNSIAALLLTEEQLAEHRNRQDKLQSCSLDLKGLLQRKLVGAVDEDSAGSASSTESTDSDSESLDSHFSFQRGRGFNRPRSSYQPPPFIHRPRMVVDVSGAEAVLNMASGDDQEQEAQRLRHAANERAAIERLAEAQADREADRERDEAYRWNRARWGQRPVASGEEQRRREQGVERTGNVRPGDVLAAALRSAAGSNARRDDALERQRKREAEIEAKQIERETNEEDTRRGGDDINEAVKWSRASWSQTAGGDPAKAGIEQGGKRGSYAFKTVLCRYHATGHCRSGSDCGFAHGAAELRGIRGGDGTSDKRK